eukprot:GFUD01040208.1.p1 GENE.GFUD01040208.1~~GFUD01040208.1.p1  ORF type:complete len:240 (-),score=37.23 GFUD01040208.1:13-732(-)
MKEETLLLCFMAVFALGQRTCSDILDEQNVAERFPYYVAHGSHSLTLNDIRAFFDATASEENGIAIVNFNLREDLLLPNAPLIRLNNRFSSSALFALDHILSHMEDNEYDIKNANALDRITHALHMQEFWSETSKFFNKLSQKARSEKMCSCIQQIYGEDITQELLHIAKQIRNSVQMYVFHFETKTKLKRSEKLLAMASIVDEESWDSWKNETTVGLTQTIKDEMAYNFALYLGCKLP